MLNRVIFMLVLSAVLTGCGGNHEQSTHARVSDEQRVDVIAAQSIPYQRQFSYTTQLRSSSSIDLKPRISGIVQSILVHDGDPVRRGDLLILLDAKPFRAEVQRLKVRLQSALEAQEQAKREARYVKKLVALKVMSVAAAEQQLFKLRQREVELNKIQSELITAQFNLDSTQIRAPMDGVVSSTDLMKGYYVQSGMTTLMTLMSPHHIQAYFNMDEQIWNYYFSGMKGDSSVRVHLSVAGSSRDYSGRLNVRNDPIHLSKGTLQVRAIFDDELSGVTPGCFRRVTLMAPHVDNRIVIPEKSIRARQNERFVYLVDANRKVVYRKVILGERIHAVRVIKSGLKAGDTVILNAPVKVELGRVIVPQLTETKAWLEHQS
ncbi:efflux RND transporter periplasmic adaptor subunit [Celerinatantimonas sp. YJH-8]|uniref:efflux RND transporter periplasmic adaptor subunit n=1 Tax=Celerinatantimonas sp. YJH-8 TaxID=3228714 RepID=UPI0038BF6C2B